MTASRLLLLIPATSYKTADFLAAADRLAVDVTVGSAQRHVLEAFSQGRTLTVSFDDEERGIRDICAHAESYPLRAILGVDEQTAVLAAAASRALGLPHNPPDAVAAAADKHRFRAAMADAGVPSPPFLLIAADTVPEEAAARTAYPCVLKPLKLSASRGVIRADTPDEFMAAYRRIMRMLGDTEKDILVEGYIPGREVALEGLLAEGNLTVLALFDKPDPLEGPFFEETIYVTPSRLPAAAQRRIEAAARQAVSALGLRDGPIHAELRLNDRGAWIIELGARSIGGLCGRSLRFGAGLSLEEIVLRHFLGKPAETAVREAAASGVMMIPIPNAGTLRAVHGLEDARNVDGIDDVAVAIPLGDAVVPLPEGDRYLGFIFARGDRPRMVEDALRAAHRLLRFQIEPEAVAHETGVG